MELPTIINVDIVREMCAVASCTPAGCFVEVGVYQGGSALAMLSVARQQGREMFAYDTFTGIPYKGEHDSHNVGDFSDTSFEKVSEGLKGATVIQGVFPASAVKMPPVAFVHLDCDQYQSIKDSLNHLLPLMVDGGIIWFDDYGCLEGANKAVREFFSPECLYGSKTGKVFVRIDKMKEAA
jgi:O-methyltransferase